MPLVGHVEYVSQARKQAPEPMTVKKVIKGNWVYKYKIDSKGNITRYKSRFVTKGYEQKDGLDYKDTFAPTSKHASLRVVLALAVKEDLELKQFGLKTRILYEDIEE
ncbi:hypothetical protein AXG93_4368s1050 [Marchantia polymorpha subsp. ruderalis]|uniref:Reverse transcriptase Ty1/copia-type domain-containing protein n=1 Tax=Marchantia polymorpha subsp. ruderalis TaxID=1480154 RepID=A0A176W0D9_MARPO|nr:hypothetical protein AXG93_4368s1050 [Marchantia polymorpha subsp. ruderalis]